MTRDQRREALVSVVRQTKGAVTEGIPILHVSSQFKNADKSLRIDFMTADNEAFPECIVFHGGFADPGCLDLWQFIEIPALAKVWSRDEAIDAVLVAFGCARG